MELRKVCIADLEDFIKSDFFQQLDVKPISTYRVHSFTRNPQAQHGDFVLYFLEKENQIIAFRTLLPAQLTNEKERFVWLSGAWTHPKQRRNGYSRKLLDEVFQDWKGRVLATNFSPLSKALYDNSGLLRPFISVKGKRFYLFVDSKKLLLERTGNLFWLFPFLDLFFNFAANFKIRKYRTRPPARGNLKKLNFPDQECLDFVDKLNADYLVSRGSSELKWMLAYPWIIPGPVNAEAKYPFSSYANHYEVCTVKFFKDGTFAGFLIYSLRDGHLKLLEIISQRNIFTEAAQFLKQEAVNRKIEFMTILDNELADKLEQDHSPFVFSKSYEDSIYKGEFATKATSKLRPAEGDSFFV